jgi:hypothetical protein
LKIIEDLFFVIWKYECCEGHLVHLVDIPALIRLPSSFLPGLAFQCCPSISEQDQKIGDVVYVLRVVLQDDAVRKEITQIFNQLRLKAALYMTHFTSSS